MRRKTLRRSNSPEGKEWDFKQKTDQDHHIVALRIEKERRSSGGCRCLLLPADGGGEETEEEEREAPEGRRPSMSCLGTPGASGTCAPKKTSSHLSSASLSRSLSALSVAAGSSRSPPRGIVYFGSFYRRFSVPGTFWISF